MKKFIVVWTLSFVSFDAVNILLVDDIQWQLYYGICLVLTVAAFRYVWTEMIENDSSSKDDSRI